MGILDDVVGYVWYFDGMYDGMYDGLSSGKRLLFTMENPPMEIMGKSTVSMAIFNSELLVYKRLVESWIIFFFLKND